MGFQGYRRPDGRYGIRNHVLVMSSVSCANGVVAAIGRELPEVQTITHTEGCGRGPEDVVRTINTLAGVATHPNVARVLIVGLGCEVIKAQLLHKRAGGDERIEYIGIQETGGTPKTVARGVEIARRMLGEAGSIEREQVGWEHLTVAMECGGSDAMSGLTANPTLGKVADWLVGQGGSVILSEITEFIGTETIVSARCASEEVRDKMMKLVSFTRDDVKRRLGGGADMVIAPGNQDGGLSSIQEKSLGCIRKGGTTAIQGVLDYAEAPTARGLNIMDTPGSDIFSITGKTAAGAQLVIFTTGRGSPAGSPIVPVIKVATTTKLFEWMPDDMDFDAGRVMAGMSLDAAGEELAGLVGEVVAGKRTCPERNQTELFAIHTTGGAF